MYGNGRMDAITRAKDWFSNFPVDRVNPKGAQVTDSLLVFLLLSSLTDTYSSCLSSLSLPSPLSLFSFSSSILIYIQKPVYFGSRYSARALRMRKVPEKSEEKRFYWMKYFTRGRLWVWTFSGWSDDAPWAPMWKPPSSFRQTTTALQPSPRNLSRFLLFSYGQGQKNWLISSFRHITRIGSWRMAPDIYFTYFISARVADNAA